MVQFSKDKAIAMAPTNWKLYIFVQISNGSDKMAAICMNFKWLGFQISDSIWNPDHLQTNLLLTIQIGISPDFRSPP